MSMTTIGIAAGGALAAAVAVAAASGGGDGGSSGGTGSGGGGGGGTGSGPSTPPGGVSLSGRWNGNERWVGTGSGFGATVRFDCTTAFSIDLTHSGTSLTGTGSYGATSCAVSVPFEYGGVTPPPGGSFQVGNGTASNGTLTFTIPQDPCPPMTLRGTYTASRFDLTGSVSCNTQGVSLQFDGTITGTR
jgi:hypothetical protein